jgi:hypothetical protein
VVDDPSMLLKTVGAEGPSVGFEKLPVGSSNLSCAGRIANDVGPARSTFSACQYRGVFQGETSAGVGAADGAMAPLFLLHLTLSGSRRL